MHATIDYSKIENPRFQAVEDIKDWLGQEKWDKLYPEMSKVTNCYQFAMYCSLAGIQGFPVRAWYELIHGEGSWNEKDFPKEPANANCQ